MVRHRSDDPAAEHGPQVAQARLRDLAEAVGQALRETKLTALTSAVDDQAVGALLVLANPAAEESALSAFAAALRRIRLVGSGPAAVNGAVTGSGPPVIVAAGSGVASLPEARRSLLEARQVADAARRDRRDLPVYRLPHVGLAGLLHLLRDEPRLQTFVERELGPLLAYDAGHPREQLLETLRAYLEQGRNKSAAAARRAPVPAGLLRPAGPDRPDPRRRPRLGRGLSLPARRPARPGRRPRRLTRPVTSHPRPARRLTPPWTTANPRPGGLTRPGRGG